MFHSISPVHVHLRAVIMHGISNVGGIHQWAWDWDGTTGVFSPFALGGMSNGWIATPGISCGRRIIGSAQNWLMERWESLVLLHMEKSVYGYDNFWLLLCQNICPAHLRGIENNVKKHVYNWSLAMSWVQSSTLGKDTLCPALAVACNPKISFKIGGNIFRVICVALCNWCSSWNCQMSILQKGVLCYIGNTI